MSLAGGDIQQELGMHIGLDAAVEIYAKACRAWYGGRAKRVVLERANQLHRTGDMDGSKVWQRVADELDELAANVKRLPSASR